MILQHRCAAVACIGNSMPPQRPCLAGRAALYTTRNPSQTASCILRLDASKVLSVPCVRQAMFSSCAVQQVMVVARNCTCGATEPVVATAPARPIARA